MVFIQKVDRQKFIQTPLYYKGNGLNAPLNNHYLTLTLQKQGGFLNNIIDFVGNNKELLQQGVSTVGNIVNATKSISDAIKTSKELEIQKVRKAKNVKKEKEEDEEIKLTPEQETALRNLVGSGFKKF